MIYSTAHAIELFHENSVKIRRLPPMTGELWADMATDKIATVGDCDDIGRLMFGKELTNPRHIISTHYLHSTEGVIQPSVMFRNSVGYCTTANEGFARLCCLIEGEHTEWFTRTVDGLIEREMPPEISEKIDIFFSIYDRIGVETGKDFLWMVFDTEYFTQPSNIYFGREGTRPKFAITLDQHFDTLYRLSSEFTLIHEGLPRG